MTRHSYTAPCRPDPGLMEPETPEPRVPVMAWCIVGWALAIIVGVVAVVWWLL